MSLAQKMTEILLFAPSDMEIAPFFGRMTILLSQL